MKRLFWFGLGVVAGARLNRKANAAITAFTNDPLRELDRLIRVGMPLAQKAMRAARNTIED